MRVKPSLEASDAWFVGFTPELVIACYVGFDTPRTLGPKMTGGRVAGLIWAEVFRRIHATRDDWKMSFDPPVGAAEADICAETGKLVSETGGKGYRDVR